MNKHALEALENSIKHEPDDFTMFKDDLLGWIEIIADRGKMSVNERLVLDYLKSRKSLREDSFMESIASLNEGYYEDCLSPVVKEAYTHLDENSELKVAKAFLTWYEEQGK